MVIVKNRTIMFSNKEQYIGTSYDNNSMVRVFIIKRLSGDGIDIAHLSFRINIRRCDGTEDTDYLEKEITKDSIVLTWTIKGEANSVPGTVFVRLRAHDYTGSVKWSTYEAPVYIGKMENLPSLNENQLSEIERMEAKFDALFETEELRVLAEEQRREAERERESAENSREERTNAVVTNAERATSETQVATQNANTATGNANTAAGNANAAANRVDTAINTANASAENAGYMAVNAANAAESAYQQALNAQNAAGDARVIIEETQIAKQAAMTATDEAHTAADSANAAAENANQAAANANSMPDRVAALEEETAQLKGDLDKLGVFVTPQMFGAKGDGVTDDTEAIQNAFNSGEKIFFPKGTYCVSVGDTANDYNFYSALKIPSNTIVDFNGSIIQCSPVDGNAKEKYTVIYLDECNNVVLKNGVIIGDKENHTGIFSEYGHGIATFRCKNAKIENMTIREHIGDGICMQAEYTTAESPICSSDNIIVSKCEIYNCRRQGISVIGANNVHIDLCYIHDISGTSPQSCINIEGNANERKEFPTNIVISNCRLLNTADSYRGLLVYDRAYDVFAFGCECSDITLYGKCNINGCFTETFHNFADEEVKIHSSTIGTLFSNGHWGTFANCDISEEIRIVVQSSREHCTLKFENCSIHGLVNSGNATNYDLIFIGCYLSIDGFMEIITVNSIEFYNCTIETKERFLAGNFNIIKMQNCNVFIENAVATGIFYRFTETKEVEIVSSSFMGNNPNVSEGVLFGGNADKAIKSILFIGNICNDRTTLYDGIVESVVSSNNYKASLNY